MTKRHLWRVVSNVSLLVLFAGFAAANLLRWYETGRPVGLGATALEALAAALFVLRRSPIATSGRVIAWLAAPAGTFGMLLARPVHDVHAGALVVGEGVQLAGVVIAVAALGRLGRSFGIVAANRGIQTRGLYGVVRHPLYTGYFITYLGYAAENPSLRNALILAVVTCAQLVRIREEELVLLGEPDYACYRQTVRRRLVPFLY
jgi:protein-S-isoprenylcysteine O-methyltransferase Ste14